MMLRLGRHLIYRGGIDGIDGILVALRLKKK
jgi:hypothetical protein